MSKKFGKFLLAATALGTAAVAAYHFLQKKDSALDTQEDGDEDYDDFSDSLDEETETPSRSYVSLDPETVPVTDAAVEEDASATEDTEPEPVDKAPVEKDAEPAAVEIPVEEVAEPATVEIPVEEVAEPATDQIPTACETSIEETETTEEADDFFVEETIVEVAAPVEEPATIQEEEFEETEGEAAPVETTTPAENLEEVPDETITSNVQAEETANAAIAPDKEAEDFDEEAIALSEAINSLVEEITDSDIEAEAEDDDFFVEETITITSPAEDTAVSVTDADEPTVTEENIPATNEEAAASSNEVATPTEEENFVEETETDSFSPLSSQVSVEEIVEEFFDDDEDEI